LFSEGKEFHAAVMASVKYAMGGDHTRTAVTELHQQFPQHAKWQIFKKVTIMITGTSPDAFQMCKDLGVMYNSKQYHKEMGFADRLLLTHKYFESQNQLGKNMRRSAEVTAWCEKQCALANVRPNSWSQYSAAARLDGEAWFYMEAILKGKYGTAIKRGHFPAVVPTTQSPMIKILSCPEDVVINALKSVYNGTLSIAMLSNEADNYKAFAMVKQMIVWAVQMESTQAANEKTVATAYPYLMTRGFIISFTLPVKAMMKKNKDTEASDCPQWIKSKVVDHLNYKHQVCAAWRFFIRLNLYIAIHQSRFAPRYGRQHVLLCDWRREGNRCGSPVCVV
jgi:hypothetical protein